MNSNELMNETNEDPVDGNGQHDGRDEDEKSTVVATVVVVVVSMLALLLYVLLAMAIYLPSFTGLMP